MISAFDKKPVYEKDFNIYFTLDYGYFINGAGNAGGG